MLCRLGVRSLWYPRPPGGPPPPRTVAARSQPAHHLPAGRLRGLQVVPPPRHVMHCEALALIKGPAWRCRWRGQGAGGAGSVDRERQDPCP